MLNHVLVSTNVSNNGSKFYEAARESAEYFIDHGCTFSHLEWDSYAWPGGYPIYYYTKDCGVLCPKCANEELLRTIDPEDEQFYVVDGSINYEDTDLHCDHCGGRVPSAYGED